MKNRQDETARKDTLDEKAKPKTTPAIDAQIEQKKAERRSGEFPPPPAPEDNDIEQAVERKSWDTLKAEPINRRKDASED
ncbi:hypothetical protein [Henriciella sp.]|uniref:hypothetical protein n=1 Tax=Henriciella sp. TaxID=1968823 RepID=UPI001803BC4B|nr:hypothetical protein [Henriciella sp.]HIG21227.1 hypothetical protein [Henriciella sp.]